MKSSSLKYVRDARENLFSSLHDPMLTQVTLNDLSKVVLILSSSRSGSSLLFELLKQTPQLLSLHSEHVPLYKLNSCNLPFNNIETDGLVNRISLDLVSMSRDFVSEIGMGVEVKHFDFARFAQILALRLLLQWPQLNLSSQEWLSYIQKAYQHFCQHYRNGWNTTFFFLELLNLLYADGYHVNPYYYDMPRNVIRECSPTSTLPQGPPDADDCIEEPPFTVIKPRQYPIGEDFKSKPLLLKASVDAYQLPFLKQLFSNAQFKIIHLTRNPAASINGLYDGWLDRGFFSHNLRGHATLSISGYSDKYEWGKYWWNYDLPPNWQGVINHPLEYVCAFQWYSAHASILKDLTHEDQGDVLRVKFEDLLLSTHHRYVEMSRILKFIGIEFDHSLQSIIKNMPVVMATVTPSERRWETRRKQIWPVVNQSSIAMLAHHLGYSLKNEEVWL